MNKGMTTGVKILITLFIALVVVAIFFYMQTYTKKGSGEYINGTSNASIPGMTLKDILNLFGKEDKEMTDFYCANSIPGMMIKDFGSCSGSSCSDDRIYSDDNNCDDAYGSYNQWKDDNTYVAVCLEGDGCLEMPDPQTGQNVGQCLLVDLTKFNGNLIQLNGLMIRVDADSSGNCNNDLYVYGKNESGSWKTIAGKLDGSGDSGLNGIYLDDSYFSENLSMIAICPNPDKQVKNHVIGENYDCDHKIDWVKFKTNEEPDVSICPSGEWSDEVLFKEWNGNANLNTKSYTVRTNNLQCNPPGGVGKDTGGCIVTRIYREQLVDDWGGCVRKDCGYDIRIGYTPDDGKVNKGVFIYSSEGFKKISGERKFEGGSCISGGKISDATRNYTDETNLLLKGMSILYHNGESIDINSTYWELTGSKVGHNQNCNGPMKRDCDGKHMCVQNSYDFGHYSMKVYGKYCCPKGMFWNSEDGKCNDIPTT